MFITSIYGERQWVLQRAFEYLAQDECLSGLTDERLWAKAVELTMGRNEKLPPAVSKDAVLNIAILEHPMHKAVLDQYCRFRGAESLAHFRARNTEIEIAIKRVYEITKLYTKHRSLDLLNNTSRHSSKYVLALLVVSLIAILFNGYEL